MAANINYFLQKAGGDKSRAKRMLSDYQRATKGLDAETAFKALDGGGSFDTKGGDMQRYNRMMEAKKKAQTIQNKPKRIENQLNQAGSRIEKKDAKIERKDQKIEKLKAQVAKKDDKMVQAKEKAQSFKQANEAYFADAQKRHGIKNKSAAELKALFDKQTAGLDKELAFKALDGGRMFGESDMARYKKLLEEKNKPVTIPKPQSKPKPSADVNVMPKPKPTNTVIGTGNNQINDSLNNNEGIIGDGNQQFDNSGNVDGERNMGGIGNVNTDNSFNAEDITATIGKQGDMDTTITNSQFGAGASVGNDYSVTVGNMRFGNNGGVSGSTNADSALANMQSATAYNALNDNFLQRSKSQLSGYGRAGGAIEEARKANSRPNTDQAAAFNFAGANQNYLQDKLDQVRSRYMGSTVGYQSPSFAMPIAPRPVDLDPAKDIFEKAMKGLK